MIKIHKAVASNR